MKFTKQEIRNLKRLCDAVSKVKDKPLILSEEDEFDIELKKIFKRTAGNWKFNGRYMNKYKTYDYNYLGALTKSDLQRLGASSYDIEAIFLDEDDEDYDEEEHYDSYQDIAERVRRTVEKLVEPIGAQVAFNSEDISDEVEGKIAYVGLAIFRKK